MVARVGRGLELVPAVLASALVGAMLWLSRRGLEILDESYLLRLIADPQATRASGDVYLFGFLLHPVYELVGRDVMWFRVVGITLLVAGSALVTHEALALVRHCGVRVPARSEATAALVAGASSMMMLSFNVTVPAYRTVAVLGMLVAASGLAKTARGRQLTGGVLVGAGGWLCFVGKPTSAAALLVVVALVARPMRAARPRVIGAALAGVLGSAGATLAMAGMTPVQAVTYLRRGVEDARLLGAHPWPAVLGWGDAGLQALPVFGLMVAGPVVAGLVLRDDRRGAHRAVIDVVTMVLLGLCAVVAAAWAHRSTAASGTGWQILAVGLLVPAVALVALGREWRALGPRPASVLALLGCLMVLPWVSAVGTNLPFGPAMGLATVFWVVALTVVLLGAPEKADRDRHANRYDVGHVPLVLALVGALVAVALWAVHANGPDGGSLSRNVRSAPVEGGQLLLTPQDAAIAEQLRDVSIRYQLDRRTPVVDLSGMGAGYALMTGGRPLGRAHMYGYAPGSVEAARAALSHTSCAERARAWVLYSRGNPSDISDAFTGGRLSLAADYEVIASFDFRRDGETWPMQLLRPKEQVVRAKMGCAGP